MRFSRRQRRKCRERAEGRRRPQCGFIDAIIEPAPCRSRAQELVESELLVVAASVADLAHDLTDEAVAAMRQACSERGIVLDDVAFLRSVTFDAIGHGI